MTEQLEGLATGRPIFRVDGSAEGVGDVEVDDYEEAMVGDQDSILITSLVATLVAVMLTGRASSVSGSSNVSESGMSTAMGRRSPPLHIGGSSGLGNKRKKPAVASAANAIAEFGNKFVMSMEKMVNANKSI
ncbi:MAG: hypothetical protein SGPRY_001051 [Prymnesium sp.]